MVTRADVFLVLEGVGKSYASGEGPVHALRGADLVIARREFTVVLGPSGSGKSTLLNLIGGMDRPTTGCIRRGAQEISALDDRSLTLYRRESIGFVFQFYNLVSNLTALENVALAASLLMDRRAAETTAREALEGVGLGHRMDNFPGQLSGGEMQRVAIARALAKRPAMLLCDEPTGALDSRTGVHVMALLQRTAHSTDTAVVVVTHNHALAEAADHLVRLQDGLVVEDARPAAALRLWETG